MVTVVEGVIVSPLPAVLLPVQKVVPRLTLSNVKGLLPDAPVVLFQVTRTFETVTASCGLVMVIVIKLLLFAVLIDPAKMLPQPGTGVEVLVGVKVIVGVKVVVEVRVAVKVGVIVGVSVIVLLGKGVNVINSPAGSVAVGVFEGLVGFAVDVSEGKAVDGSVAVDVLNEPVVGTTLFPDVKSRIPRIVRALEEVMVRELMGISVIIGL